MPSEICISEDFRGTRPKIVEHASQTRHSANPMQGKTDQEIFAELCENSVREPVAIALAVAGIDTVVRFRAKRGMNAENVDDAHVNVLLTKLHAIDNTIDMDVDGDDGDGLRALQLLCRNVQTVSSAVAPEVATPAAGSAAEEAANATKAVALYKRLEGNQGVRVGQDMHLDYSLIAQMDNLQKKNGTINRRVGLSNIVAQNQKKKTDRDLGMGLKVTFEEHEAEEKYKYNEITLLLRTFFTALAAILSYEVDADADRNGEVPVVASDGSGNQMCVAGSHCACMDLMFRVIEAIGMWPIKYADSIFRAAFAKTMDLASKNHFDKAVSLVMEYHPSAFRPTEEEQREHENARRSQTRTPGTKDRRSSEPSAGGGKKPKIDANAPPCHGIVYSGRCNKPECPFDHDEKRCKAYKEAHPTRPPPKGKD